MSNDTVTLCPYTREPCLKGKCHFWAGEKEMRMLSTGPVADGIEGVCLVRRGLLRSYQAAK